MGEFSRNHFEFYSWVTQTALKHGNEPHYVTYELLQDPNFTQDSVQRLFRFLGVDDSPDVMKIYDPDGLQAKLGTVQRQTTGSIKQQDKISNYGVLKSELEMGPLKRYLSDYCFVT